LKLSLSQKDPQQKKGLFLEAEEKGGGVTRGSDTHGGAAGERLREGGSKKK